MLILVGLFAGLATWFLLPGIRTLQFDQSQKRSGWPLAAAVGVLAALALLWLHGRWLVLAGVGLATLLWLRRLVARQRLRKEVDARRAAVLALSEALASDVAAGVPLSRVIARAGSDFPEFADLTAAVEIGADIPTTLRRLAETPGYDELGLVAAGWQVAADTGSGLAGVLTRLSSVLSSRQRTRRLVEAELASSRATAAIMALLPLAILLLGSSVGGQPVGFLLDTTAGLGCLAGGVLLTLIGLSWLQTIEAKASA